MLQVLPAACLAGGCVHQKIGVFLPARYPSTNLAQSGGTGMWAGLRSFVSPPGMSLCPS